MNNFIGRLMKKKQKMEENITDKENERDFRSGSTFEPGMETENHGPETHFKESDVDAVSEFPIDPGSPTHSEFQGNEVGNDTGKLEKEISELKDKYVRLYAEFDNFKRRTSKERSELFKTANKEVLVSLLPVLDDMERAQKSFTEAKELDPIKEGLGLITSKFKNFIAAQGIKEINSIGEKFDTDLHEAITNVPAQNQEMKGKVIDEMEKGYMLNDKVIRFAKVIVGV